MTGASVSCYPHRTMIVWVTLLLGAWLVMFSPLSAAWNAALTTLALISSIFACAQITRSNHAHDTAAKRTLADLVEALNALPPGIERRMPLVIAIGIAIDDSTVALQNAFDTSLVRVTDTAIWIRTDKAAHLCDIADALKRRMSGQGPDALVWLIEADSACSAADLTEQLTRWRAATVRTQCMLGYRLPVCIALYGREGEVVMEPCPWFGVTGAAQIGPDTLPSLLAPRAARYVQAAGPDSGIQSRAHRVARLDALSRWACELLWPTLSGVSSDVSGVGTPLALWAFGVTTTAGAPAPDGPFARFTTQITALRAAPAADASAHANPAATASNAATATLTLPDPLLAGIPLQPRKRPSALAFAHGLAWLAVAFCAAVGVSASNNHTLAARIEADITHYRALPVALNAARLDALAALRQDREELEGLARTGIPPHLGFGLYRGASLMQRVIQSIASYQPPAPSPHTIELDGLALFATGHAVLKPGSNRALVAALTMIQSHPEKRVLIAGHADAAGKPEANRQLSEARAAAVRDWLADASGIPVTRFAIQGYGATRPIASNATTAGRAANRRVDITLVPDCPLASANTTEAQIDTVGTLGTFGTANPSGPGGPLTAGEEPWQSQRTCG